MRRAQPARGIVRSAMHQSPSIEAQGAAGDKSRVAAVAAGGDAASPADTAGHPRAFSRPYLPAHIWILTPQFSVH